MKKSTATGAVAAVALAGALVAAPPAQSRSPHEVDPATVQPPLNPQFDPYSCWEAGAGITCTGLKDVAYHEPIGLFCDGQEVWVSGSGHEKLTRWHDADGLALRTIVHLDYPADVFTLTEDGSGPSFTIAGHWNRHYVYPVPGDLSQRVLTEVGAIWLGRAGAGGPLAIHDTGTVTYEPGQDFETVAEAHGIHDALEPGLVDQAICDALT